MVVRRRAGISCGLVVSIAAARAALAQYPSGPQITKDGTAVVLEDYASVPLSGIGGSVNFAGQLSRVNFLRGEPSAAPQAGNRFFVNDNNRNLYLLDKTTRAFTPYMNFQTIFPKFENNPYSGGMVSFAFDPEYATSGKFYTQHTEDPAIAGSATPNSFPGFSNSGYTTTPTIITPVGGTAREGIIVEWTDTNLSNNTFEGTAREVIRIGFVSNIHRLGDMTFNPNAQPGDADYRNLYISNGDGASGELTTTRQMPQRLDALQGKILRITPDTSLRPATSTISANGRYSVPSSGGDANPFVGVSGARNEIFAYGFRNPHRMDFDATTGRLFVNDIGLTSWEEVNIVAKGANYGYSEREGTEQLFIGGPNHWKTGSRTSPPTPFPSPDTLTVTGLGSVTPTYPVANYSHHDGDGISSGFVYRGTLVPELIGKYVFGDITTARLFYADVNDLIAADDGVRTTVAGMHELQIVYDSPYNAAALEQRRLYDVIADEYAGKGGDPKAGSSLGVLPGSATIVGGWSGSTFNPGTVDYYGAQYGGGRADMRIVVGGDGEIYVLSKSDAMIRRVTSAMHFWNASLSGAWSSAANWTNGVADGVGCAAHFGPAAAAGTVTVDGTRTAGLLYFNSSGGAYTLGGGTIQLNAAAPQAGIYVAAGNHVINAAVTLADDTTITIAPAAALRLSNLAQSSQDIRKVGGGTLEVNNVRAASLTIDGGTVRVSQQGANTGVSTLDDIAIATGADFDLTNNKLIVRSTPIGGWDGSAYTGVSGMIQRGEIGSSLSNGVLTRLAVATAEETGYSGGTFGGQSVTGDDVLVFYTWGGDADLNGELNGDDYFYIDSNAINSGSVFGFHNGDFNLDGEINGDDYFIIDSNITYAQASPPFPTGAGGLAAVPEPAAAGVALIALLVRRRRRVS